MTQDKRARFDKEMIPHMDSQYNYALYLTGDRDEASDLLQETFLKAYRFFDSFQPGSNAGGWLHRIMRNTYINDYRRAKRLPDFLEFDEQLTPYRMLPVEASSERHDRATDLRDIYDDELASAVSSLPEKFKSVVVLRDIEQLSYEEISESLRVPVGTVRSRLHRARSLLFERLRTYAKSRGYRVGEKYETLDYAIAS